MARDTTSGPPGVPPSPSDSAGSADSAHYWRHPALGGLDLLRARYVRHSWGWHRHPTYAIGALRTGAEEIDFPEGRRRVEPGQVVVIPPDTAHTGRAAAPEGWTYRVIYPSSRQLHAVADAVAGHLPADDGGRVLHDPELAAALLGAHREAENGDPLAADTWLHLVLRRTLTAYESGRHLPLHRSHPGRSRNTAAAGLARRTRDALLADITRSPSLTQLATAVDSSPFRLLRAFRRAYGMPPHAYLTDVRVAAARRHLAAGTPAGDVAARLGFCDQSHLTRHFRRLVGVPPGAYQRAVQERPSLEASR